MPESIHMMDATELVEAIELEYELARILARIKAGARYFSLDHDAPEGSYNVVVHRFREGHYVLRGAYVPPNDDPTGHFALEVLAGKILVADGHDVAKAFVASFIAELAEDIEDEALEVA